MGKYVLKDNKEVVVTVEKVKKDTVIKHKTFGEILVTKGNNILTYESGEQVGIADVDLKAFYKPAK